MEEEVGAWRVLIEIVGEDLEGALDKVLQQYTFIENNKQQAAVVRTLIQVVDLMLEQTLDIERRTQLVMETLLPIVLPCIEQEEGKQKSKARSFLLLLVDLAAKYPKDVGEAIEDLIVKTLLKLMEEEKDFVELDPIAFVEAAAPNAFACLNKVQQVEEPAEREQEDNISRIHPHVLVKLLAEHIARCNDAMKNERILTLEAASVALLACTHQSIVTIVCKRLVPALVKAAHLRGPSDEGWIKELIWKRIVQIYNLPSTNLLRGQIWSIFGKLVILTVSTVNSIDAKSTPFMEASTFDIKTDGRFWQLLIAGIRSNDSEARKYSMFLLNMALDALNRQASSDSGAYITYVTASDKGLWTDFLDVYDCFHQTQLHIMEPLLPKLVNLILLTTPTRAINESRLPPPFVLALIHRALQNDSPSFRKNFLTYLLSIKNEDALIAMAKIPDLLFQAILPALDVHSMFTIRVHGSYISEFGEAVRTFWNRLMVASQREPALFSSISCDIIHQIGLLKSPVPAIYIAQGCFEHVPEIIPERPWGVDELVSACRLVSSDEKFQRTKSRALIRQLCIDGLNRYVDFSLITFDHVYRFCSASVDHYENVSRSDALPKLRRWLQDFYCFDVSRGSLEGHLLGKIRKLMDINASDGQFKYSAVRSYAYELSNFMFLVAPLITEASWTAIVNALTGGMTEDLPNYVPLNTLVFLDRLFSEDNALHLHFADVFLKALVSSEVNTILVKVSDGVQSVLKQQTEDLEFGHVYARLLKAAFSDQATFDQHQHLFETTCTAMADLFRVEDNLQFSLAMLHAVEVICELCRLHHLESFMPSPTFAERLTILTEEDVLTEEEQHNKRLGKKFMHRKWAAVTAIELWMAQKIQEQDRSVLLSVAISELEQAYKSQSLSVSQFVCLRNMLAQPIARSRDDIERLIQTSAKIVEANLKKANYDPVILKNLADMMFQPTMIDCCRAQQLSSGLQTLFATYQRVADTKGTIMALVALPLCHYLQRGGSVNIDAMKEFNPELVAMLIFGPLRDRDDQKADRMMESKLANSIREEEQGNYQDAMVRVMASSLLLQLDKDNREHADFAWHLFQELWKLSRESRLQNTYLHLNQQEHLEKFRLWCSASLLCEFLLHADTRIVDMLVETILTEEMTSVRCYAEWILCRILIAKPEHLPAIFCNLEQFDLKPHSIMALLTVTFPLSEHFTVASLEAYYNSLIEHYVPFLTAAHFGVRSFGQWGFLRTWKACVDRMPDAVQLDRSMTVLHKYIEQASEAIKFRKRVEDSYYLAKFNPFEDYNLEFIFLRLPTIHGVSAQELISPHAFERLGTRSRIPLFGKEGRYSAIKSVEISLGDAAVTKEKEESTETADAFFQRKITPWKAIAEADIRLAHEFTPTQQRMRSDIIVCASLLEMIPNLGGLCRTCEIFNASLLTIDSMKVLKDPKFTALSVSAERWMPIQQVRKNDIAEFMRQKKKEGYMLCGLEQTSQSVSLHKVRFPSKCLLLLGRERTGIPVELLAQLDQTIEIPQLGVLRSLNVHVSGSICMYEYARQMAQSQK
ncbi:hypothetical protein BZG36_02986 [Bifiguratus adelaidae]|uniref:tRNA/rRNA methyltransferase SpoU type domain-containing protein n=1 Tax=Bifiguratus adelaidae TaxID=1938954 RepID=A0A261XYE4_9FUNG|nr:hypothetical protein BZG36_02986 [Bifiguratus adelaidae]